MKKILGISAFYHDSAAAVCIDGKIVCAAQEERFTRIKNDASFPTQSIAFCLEFTKLNFNDFDSIVFYDKPLLKFERILETYYQVAPKGIFSFFKSIPIWFNEKLFIKQNISKALNEIQFFDKKKTPILFTEHHLSHAASSFFTSPFHESAILTIDGVGEWATVSISKGKNNSIELIKEMHFPHSVGLLYSSFTYFLGFKVNSGEYKMMGLAPYGNPLDPETIAFEQKIKSHLITIFEDGSILMNQDYFSYTHQLKMIDVKKWEHLLGLKKRIEESEILSSHCNLAFAIQKVTEEIVLLLAKHAKDICNSDNLCLAGGVALNCVANGKIQKEQIFKDIYIQAASGDAGGAIGAALSAYYIYGNNKRENPLPFSPYLGPKFLNNSEIFALNNSQVSIVESIENEEAFLNHVSKLILNNKVIAWFQGEMEFGPRALGNRSIIANPSHPDMQTIINLKVKKREAFRPFAPVVLEEDAHLYFDSNQPSPVMLMVYQLKNQLKKTLPANFHTLSVFDQLKTPRSEFQSITHVDFSARVQTVSDKDNTLFYKLLKAVKLQTGHGMLINTSMNLRGEPMVCSPEDAYRFFTSTEIDYLVINQLIFSKLKNEK